MVNSIVLLQDWLHCREYTYVLHNCNDFLHKDPFSNRSSSFQWMRDCIWLHLDVHLKVCDTLYFCEDLENAISMINNIKVGVRIQMLIFFSKHLGWFGSRHHTVKIWRAKLLCRKCTVYLYKPGLLCWPTPTHALVNVWQYVFHTCITIDIHCSK